MAVFFLLVGLEIKRELLVGELSTLRQAALPFAAALGGDGRAGLLYLAAGPGRGAARLGRFRRPPTSPSRSACWRWWRPARRPALKVFLAALAIVDDLAAVLVIALFYTAARRTGAAAGGGRGRLAGRSSR